MRQRIPRPTRPFGQSYTIPERTGSYPYTNSVLGIVNEKLTAAGVPESQLTSPIADFSGNYTARAHTFSIGVGFSF